MSRLYKHPSSKGDEGDALLYLEALIHEIPEARADLESTIDTFSEHSGDSVLLRASLAISYAPPARRVKAQYLRQAQRERAALKRRPFKAFQMLLNTVPNEGLLDATAGLDGETFHAKSAQALTRFNNLWLNGHPNGMRALQLVCAHGAYMALGGDLQQVAKDRQLIKELLYGSGGRSKTVDGARISALVSRVRKAAGKQGLGYQNKNAKEYLGHARLAVQVLYKHKGSLETALKERLGADPAKGPFTTDNLSSRVSPFFRALGIRLNGREPLEGRDPIHLPDFIRKDHSSRSVWLK
jgi:hypothetical protein